MTARATPEPASPTAVRERAHVTYPCTDGQPMAEDTLQYEWIVMLKGNLDALLPDAFVGGDLLWYPVEGDNRTRRAPDVLVAFGRPKGHRSSYMQWEEAGVAPQVVIEVWSPGNTFPELVEKHRFYEQHGVQEFIVVDPDRNSLSVWERKGERLDGNPVAQSWTSSRLGLRFEIKGEEVQVFGPDGQRLRTFAELHAHARQEAQRAEQEAHRAEQEAQRAEQEAQRAEQEAQRASAAEARAQALAARLAALGIDPDAL